MKPSHQDTIDLASAADMALTQMEQANKAYQDDPEWQNAIDALRIALTLKQESTDLFVLTIDNDSGLTSSLHRSREGATQALYTYVKDNWTGTVLAQLGPLPKVSAPQDVDLTIETYFTRDEGDDRAEIEAVTLED